MQPIDPNVGANGAPAPQSPSPPPTTSRQAPDQTAIAAFRMAQSANDRLAHISGVVQNLANLQTASNDEQFYERLGAQFTDGSIDQATFTRKVAERTAQRVAAQSMIPPAGAMAPPPAPAPPQAAPDPQAEARRARDIGARAILSGLGLQGNESGLDYASPRALLESGQRVLIDRQAQQPPPQQDQNGLNVNDAMGQLAREQGYVIPHRDGGRPTGQHPVPTEADLDAIVWDKDSSHAPRQRVALLRNVRQQLAGRTPTLKTGERLLGNPRSFQGG